MTGYSWVGRSTWLVWASAAAGFFVALALYPVLGIASADNWRLYFRYYPLALALGGITLLLVAERIFISKADRETARSIPKTLENWGKTNGAQRVSIYSGLVVMCFLFALMGFVFGGHLAHTIAVIAS